MDTSEAFKIIEYLRWCEFPNPVESTIARISWFMGWIFGEHLRTKSNPRSWNWVETSATRPAIEKTRFYTQKHGKKLISDDLVCENRENRGNPSLYRRFSDIPRMVGLIFPIFGSAGDKNHITVRFQIKSSPQTEIHTPSSPKTVSALFSTPWIFQILYATLLSRCTHIEAIPRPNS